MKETEKTFEQASLLSVEVSAAKGDTLHIRQKGDFIVIEEQIIPEIIKFIKQTYNL